MIPPILSRPVAAAEYHGFVFVTPEADAAPIEGLNPAELFVWPRDEDRLMMAFMTGA